MTGGLKIENLHFGYDKAPILGGIDLEIAAGEMCAVIGQSGSGKTTLIKCLLQLERPQTGIVTYGGRQISYNRGGRGQSVAASLELRRRLGYVPQSSLLYPHLSALRNVTLALTEAHGQSKTLAAQNALHALGQVGVSDLAKLSPWRLSGGQQQRIAIARALAVRPEIFLLDEATAALDVQSSQVIGAALRADVRSRQACALLVTHNLAFAKRNCDSIALLAAGRIQWHLKTSEVQIDKALMEVG